MPSSWDTKSDDAIDVYALAHAKTREKIKAKMRAAYLAELPDLSAFTEGEDPDEVKGPSGRVYSGEAFSCMRPATEPRRTCILLVEHPLFDPIVLCAIMGNCLTMAWESPLDPAVSWKAGLINFWDACFLIVFTAEMALKMVAYGLLFLQGAYLRDGWCQLDFTLITLAWLPIFFPGTANYSALRALRALRPLRALKRLPGMPILVQWILDVTPKMGNVFLLLSFVYLVFGIGGLELFKGALEHRCAVYDATLGPPDDLHSYLDTGVPCDVRGESGGAPRCSGAATCLRYPDSSTSSGGSTFDSIGATIITLIQATTFDRWAPPMYGLMASFSPYVWTYFFLIVLVGGFFVVNLFLAVIFLELGSSKERVLYSNALEKMVGEGEKGARISPAAARSGDAAEPNDGARLRFRRAAIAVVFQNRTQDDRAGKVALGLLEASCAALDSMFGLRLVEWLEAPPSEDALRKCLEAVATSAALSHLATGLVLVNIALMCMPYEGMPKEYADALEGGVTAVTWLFVLEMACKLYGLGCVRYWADGWNVLDGGIVILSVLEMVLTALFAGSGMSLSFLRMLRMLRVLRMLRLMRAWRGLHRIVSTFVRTIPQMVNIVILICLCMFIFALIGMQLFGGVWTEANGYSPVHCVTDSSKVQHRCANGLQEKPRFHFDYSGPSMITVFIVLTGEWVDQLEPVASVFGPSASIFFISVVVLGKFLLINLLVAVILHEFAEDNSGPSTERSTKSDASDATGASHRKIEQRWQSKSDRSAPWPEGYSLLLFGPDSELRATCRWALRQSWFEQLILAAILASSMCLIVDTPRVDPMSSLAWWLSHLNSLFTLLFVLEMMIKSIAMNFAFGDGAYLKSPWNQLDFAIVSISLLLLLADSVPQLRSLRILRVARVLRPLRLISRNPGMRLVIESLFKAMSGVTNVFGVVIVLQLVFAILGMQMFSGMLARCEDPAYTTAAACVGASHRWGNPAIGSFDDFGSAMRLLYVMSSADEWDVPMFAIMGATEAGVAPGRNDFSLSALFPIAWMFFSYIFAINLFIGVIVDNFNRIKQEEEGETSMTLQQRQWASTMQASLRMVPSKASRPPNGWWRRRIHGLVTSHPFEMGIMGVIGLNIGVMACDYYGIEAHGEQYAAYTRALDFFAIIYYAECVLKLAGLGVSAYFSDDWCRFDFFLVCMSLLDQFATELLAAILPLPPYLLRAIRVFRILRILRLLRHAHGLRNLMVTMILSFPSLLNIGTLLALVIFIYAVLGVNLFTFLVRDRQHPFLGLGMAENFGSGITDSQNFVSFGNAFLLLFQCLTGDGWTRYMADATIDPSSGLCSEAEGNCGSTLAIPYFISFQIIGVFVLVNLIVAVILENL
jgi:hypothetical protein